MAFSAALSSRSQPAPASPMTFAAGASTPSKATSLTDTMKPVYGVTVTPGAFRSTSTTATPPSSVRAAHRKAVAPSAS